MAESQSSLEDALESRPRVDELGRPPPAVREETEGRRDGLLGIRAGTWEERLQVEKGRRRLSKPPPAGRNSRRNGSPVKTFLCEGERGLGRIRQG